MENELKSLAEPHNLSSVLIHQQQKSTREMDSSAVSEFPVNMRPAPAGSEDSTETLLAKDQQAFSNKPVPSSSSTPRRVINKLSISSHGFAHGLDEDKLAPLGFEPEGTETCTPLVERWSLDLLDTLKDAEGFKLFYNYLQSKNSQILLEFWSECEDFKRSTRSSPQTLYSAAKAIFQKYYQAKHYPLLELRDATRSKIAQQMNDSVVDCHIFDEALSMALTNMKNNHYQSFLAGFSDSSKAFYDRHCVGKFQLNYLPPLLEEKELGFSDFEDDNYDPKCTGQAGVCGKKKDVDRARHAAQFLHSPYHCPSAPLQSVRESENQSVSSGGLTEDSMSITTDSDGYSRSGSSRRRRTGNSQKFMQCSGLPNLTQFVPVTQRASKERRTLTKEEFARILIEKLEIVKKEQEQVEMAEDIKELEIENTETGRYGDDKVTDNRHLRRTLEAGQGMSILDRAINNKKILDKIPLSTMYEQTRSLSSGSHHSSTYSKASATNGTSTIRDSLSSGNTNKISQHSSSKPSRQDTENVEKMMESPSVNDRLDALAEEHMNRIPQDENLRMITVDHQRILQWMEQGQEELQRQKLHEQKTREQKGIRHHCHPGSSRSSSKKQSSRSSDHYPSQPVAQDSSMPLLPPPEPGTMLEEVKRRLIERDQNQKRSKQKLRSRQMDDHDVLRDKASSSSCCCSATDSSSRQSMHSFDHRLAPSCLGSSTMSSVPSSVSCVHSDSKSRDSGFSATTRSKEKRNNTVITYYMWGEPIPYRTSFDSKSVNLGQFKAIISKRGRYRYYFKRETGDRECAVVWEEFRDDAAELPTYEGKIVGKVEKMDLA